MKTMFGSRQVLLRSFSSSSSLASQQPPLTQESVLYTLKKLDKSPLKALSFFNSLPTKNANLSPNSPVYGLMLRILGRKESLTQFWDFLKSTQSNGYSLDQGTYLSLLSNFKKEELTNECSALSLYYKKLQENASFDDSVNTVAKTVLSCENFGKELEKMNLNLSEDLVIRVLRELRENPLKALAFFDWINETNPQYKHGSISYNALARVLGRDESMEKFWILIGQMKQKGFDMDIDTYVKILRQFQKRRLMKDAVKLYELMMDGPYKPAIQDCGILLRQISLSPEPDMELVYRVVKKYEQNGYSLSKPIYDGIHRSLTSNAQFEEAEEIINKMKLEGFEPDNITYSQLVYGLCKVKRFDDAREVLDEMQSNGCMPDLKTWTVLIQGICNNGEIDLALECLADMAEQNHSVDGDLLDILIKALCKANRINGAHTFFTEMVEKNRVKPWQASYKFLIHELLKAKMLEESLGLLKSMKKHKFPPFAEPFAVNIAKYGTVEDAKEFLKALTGNGYPAPAVYLNVFKCFFEEGRFAEAQDLLFKCPHHIRKYGEIAKMFGTDEKSAE
ncbi:hypothetical protein LUZ60_013535 [Juncus effusus]|nr:hypothetical protein LUZ60_013535 [Juncus effusus]